MALHKVLSNSPRCGHCKKLAPIWTKLAKNTQHKLNIAEVNCEAHSAICKKAGVVGYPMLNYYGGAGAGSTEYTGGRKLEQLQAFAEKVSGPYVTRLLFPFPRKNTNTCHLCV